MARIDVRLDQMQKDIDSLKQFVNESRANATLVRFMLVTGAAVVSALAGLGVLLFYILHG